MTKRWQLISIIALCSLVYLAGNKKQLSLLVEKTGQAQLATSQITSNNFATEETTEVSKNGPTQATSGVISTPILLALGKNAPLSVRRVAGLADGEHFSDRILALRELEQAMSLDEQRGLAIVLTHQARANGLEPQQDHFLVNEIISTLINGYVEPQEVSNALIKLFQNRAEDVVVRSYVVQFLASWYQNAPNRAEIKDALLEALTETHTTVGGTALLGLYWLAKNTVDFDKKELLQSAFSIAQDQAANKGTRATALRIVGDYQFHDVIPLATNIALSEQDIALRISAIGTLGALGGDQARQVLHKIFKTSNGVVKVAAESALKKI